MSDIVPSNSNDITPHKSSYDVIRQLKAAHGSIAYLLAAIMSDSKNLCAPAQTDPQGNVHRAWEFNLNQYQLERVLSIKDLQVLESPHGLTVQFRSEETKEQNNRANQLGSRRR